MEAPRLRDRPALIVSDSWLGNDGLMLQWTVMITSAANRGWPDDILLLERFTECGLPVASVIRVAKIATIDCASRPHRLESCQATCLPKSQR